MFQEEKERLKAAKKEFIKQTNQVMLGVMPSNL